MSKRIRVQCVENSVESNLKNGLFTHMDQNVLFWVDIVVGVVFSGLFLKYKVLAVAPKLQ